MIRSYNAIEKGISFMKGNQLESGEFVTLASPTIQMNKPRRLSENRLIGPFSRKEFLNYF